jgi:hypothetical protein
LYAFISENIFLWKFLLQRGCSGALSLETIYRGKFSLDCFLHIFQKLSQNYFKVRMARVRRNKRRFTRSAAVKEKRRLRREIREQQEKEKEKQPGGCSYNRLIEKLILVVVQ